MANLQHAAAPATAAKRLKTKHSVHGEVLDDQVQVLADARMARMCAHTQHSGYTARHSTAQHTAQHWTQHTTHHTVHSIHSTQPDTAETAHSTQHTQHIQHNTHNIHNAHNVHTQHASTTPSSPTPHHTTHNTLRLQHTHHTTRHAVELLFSRRVRRTPSRTRWRVAQLNEWFDGATPHRISLLALGLSLGLELEVQAPDDNFGRVEPRSPVFWHCRQSVVRGSVAGSAAFKMPQKRPRMRTLAFPSSNHLQHSTHATHTQHNTVITRNTRHTHNTHNIHTIHNVYTQHASTTPSSPTSHRPQHAVSSVY